MGQLEFLHCLFEPNENTCFSQTPKGTAVLPLTAGNNAHAFFSINSLMIDKDNQPTESWHLETYGRRADCNVISFRNILIEMDNFALDKQDQYITEIGVPYSTAVYSGGKSIHYIISLETPVQNIKAYRRLVSRIYKAIGEDYVDIANKNPSRLSRFPGHIRIDSTKEQKLLTIKGRVPNSVLEEWLLSRGVEDTVWEEVSMFNRSKSPHFLSNATKLFLEAGAPEGRWNLTLFKSAADFCRTGYSLDEAREAFLKITGTLTITDEKTITSAYRNEENNK